MPKWDIPGVLHCDTSGNVQIVAAVNARFVALSCAFNFLLSNSSSDDNSFQPLTRNISILRVVPASPSSSNFSVNVLSKTIIAGRPCLISFLSFDLYGNKADASTFTTGIIVTNEARNLVVSNSFFSATGTSVGTTDISTVIYSSGINSISNLQGTYGE